MGLQAELDKVPTLSGKNAVLSGKPAESAPEALQALDRLRASEAGWNWTSDTTWFRSLQTQHRAPGERHGR